MVFSFLQFHVIWYFTPFQISMDSDKTSGQSEQDDGGDEQTVVATHEQINASGMVEDQNCLEEI